MSITTGSDIMRNGTMVYDLVAITTPPAPPSYFVYKAGVEEVFAYLTLTVGGPGVIGNILTIIVLTQKTMRSSTNVYLTALAVWDCMVILTAMVLLGLLTMYPMSMYPCITIVYPVGLTAQTATIWICVSFTVERFIAVKHPLKAASMCTVKRARTVCICVSFASIGYNLPRWFEFYPFTMTPWLGMYKAYKEVYFIWLYLPVMLLIPLSALAVMNVFLIRAVRDSHRQRQDMNVRQSRENNVTLMLISVVLVFIFCQVPALVYNVAFAVDSETTQRSKPYILLSSIRNFLVVLNSCTNIILYCCFGQKFRRTFCEIFLKCLTTNNPADRQHSFSHMSNNQNPQTRVLQSKTYFKIPNSQDSVSKCSGSTKSKKPSITPQPSLDETVPCIVNRHAVTYSPSVDKTDVPKSSKVVRLKASSSPVTSTLRSESYRAGILTGDALMKYSRNGPGNAEEIELLDMKLAESDCEQEALQQYLNKEYKKNGALN